MPVADLIGGECPLRSLETDSPRPACCELVKARAEAEESGEKAQQSGLKPPQEEHFWLDPRLVESLPANIRKGKRSD